MFSRVGFLSRFFFLFSFFFYNFHLAALYNCFSFLGVGVLSFFFFRLPPFLALSSCASDPRTPLSESGFALPPGSWNTLKNGRTRGTALEGGPFFS